MHSPRSCSKRKGRSCAFGSVGERSSFESLSFELDSSRLQPSGGPALPFAGAGAVAPADETPSPEACGSSGSEIKLGDCFESYEDLRAAAVRDQTRTGFRVSAKRSGMYYHFFCGQPGCIYEIKARLRKESGVVVIKAVCEHKHMETSSSSARVKIPICQRDLLSFLLPLVQSKPWVAPRELNDRIESHFHYRPKRSTIFTYKSKILKILRGSSSSQYVLLRGILHRIVSRNSFLSFLVEYSDRQRTLKSLTFVDRFPLSKLAEGASTPAFKRIVFFDGMPLKSEDGGFLLLTVMKSGGDHTSLIAYRICARPSFDNWLGLLKELRDKGLPEQSDISFVGSASACFALAAHSLFPHVELIISERQMQRGLATRFPSKPLRGIAQALAQSSSGARFDSLLSTLMLLSPEAAMYLRGLPSSWSRHQFRNDSFGENLTNAAESFNTQIESIRRLNLPMLPMHLHNYACRMERKKARVLSKLSKAIVPHVDAQIAANTERSLSLVLVQEDPSMETFLLLDLSRDSADGVLVGVDVRARSCGCAEFPFLGLPCKHFCFCLRRLGRSPRDYVNPVYLVASARATLRPLHRLRIPRRVSEAEAPAVRGASAENSVRPPHWPPPSKSALVAMTASVPAPAPVADPGVAAKRGRRDSPPSPPPPPPAAAAEVSAAPPAPAAPIEAVVKPEPAPNASAPLRPIPKRRRLAAAAPAPAPPEAAPPASSSSSAPSPAEPNAEAV